MQPISQPQDKLLSSNANQFFNNRPNSPCTNWNHQKNLNVLKNKKQNIVNVPLNRSLTTKTTFPFALRKKYESLRSTIVYAEQKDQSSTTFKQDQKLQKRKNNGNKTCESHKKAVNIAYLSKTHDISIKHNSQCNSRSAKEHRNYLPRKKIQFTLMNDADTTQKHKTSGYQTKQSIENQQKKVSLNISSKCPSFLKKAIKAEVQDLKNQHEPLTIMLFNQVSSTHDGTNSQQSKNGTSIQTPTKLTERPNDEKYFSGSKKVFKHIRSTSNLEKKTTQKIVEQEVFVDKREFSFPPPPLKNSNVEQMMRKKSSNYLSMAIPGFIKRLKQQSLATKNNKQQERKNDKQQANISLLHKINQNTQQNSSKIIVIQHINQMLLENQKNKMNIQANKKLRQNPSETQNQNLSEQNQQKSKLTLSSIDSQKQQLKEQKQTQQPLQQRQPTQYQQQDGIQKQNSSSNQIKKISQTSIIQQKLQDNFSEQSQQDKCTELQYLQQRIQQAQPQRRISGVILADIKDALIGCNLFTEEDCDTVFSKYEKEIKNYKPNRQDKQSTYSSIKRIKSSLRELLESPNHTPEQQKMIADQCQQKRVRWILEQKSTIKESLKELSEYATQNQIASSNNIFSQESLEETVNQLSNRYIRRGGHQSFEKLFSDQQISNGMGSLTYLRKKKHRKNPSYFSTEEAQITIQDFQIKWLSESRSSKCVIYTARHCQTGSIYSLKKYNKESVAKQLTQFIQELKVQVFLDCPTIQKVYQIFSDSQHFYVLSEYHQDKLSDYLQFEQKEGYGLMETRKSILKDQGIKMSMLREVAEGIEQIHISRIVHRGIRPSTILLNHGVCKISGFNNVTILNSPFDQSYSEYMCPQTFFDTSQTSVDIWCLGVLAYQLVVGKKPFQSSNRNKTAKNILGGQVDLPADKQYLRQLLKMTLKTIPQERSSIFQIQKLAILNINKHILEQDNLVLRLTDTLQNELDRLFEH